MRDEQESLEEIRNALGDEFDIKRRLGRGKTATVYQAWEHALNRFVAIKVMHSDLARDEVARKRFERAAQAAAALRHENVADVHRIGRFPDGKTLYVVMEQVNGRTMRERLEAEGPLSTDEAVSVLKDVASALVEAHAHAIVHRDVRPDNVLWDEDKEVALLVDFGIAALLSTTGAEVTRLTRSGEQVGDPRYRSPEQLRDDDLTVMADIYAFAVMAYELLTGDGPYEAKDNKSWIRAHLTQDPKDLHALRPDLDPNVATVLMRCLNREPKYRPAARDLVRALTGEWQVDPQPTIIKRGIVKELIERRVPAAVGAGGVVSGFIIGGVTTLNQEYVDLLPRWAFTEALVTGAAIVAGSAVVGWYHGGRGAQKLEVVEAAVLASIFAAWLVASAGLVMMWG